MARETVVVPDIGSDSGEVVEVLVSPGDSVTVDQGLVVLESDKASMEIPSTVAGTLLELLVKEGDDLSEGASVAVIDTESDAEDDAGDAGGGSQSGGTQSDAEAGSRGAAAAPADDGSDAPAAARPTRETVPVPDIGTEDAVDVVEVSVKVGDRVEEGDTLIVLESDKASMEVPSPLAGEVLELQVEEGRQLREGDPILLLEADARGAGADVKEDDAAASKEEGGARSGESPRGDAQRASGSEGAAGGGPARVPAEEPELPPAVAKGTGDEGVRASGVYAGPAVRKLAREFGVPLLDVRGSGPRGRILKEDLHQYVQQALSRAASPAAGGAAIPEVPAVDFAEFGPVDVVERSKIEKLTAANMQRSWLNVPHVTQFDDADITALEDFRKSLAGEAEKRGTRLTPIPFLMKACAVALRRHERVNASLSDGGNTLTYKRYVHIGMAVDTPAGLLVPVLRDVDRKSLWELAEEVLDLAGRARDRKLKTSEMQGAGFTISSLGAIGGRGFTPIVNTPEVAILGVGKSSTQPHWDGSAFVPKLMLPLSLSYDHRVVNGGDAGRFLTELVGLLGDIRRMLL